MSDNRFLLAGLGNPGREYANNRHNLGFMVIDHLAEKFGAIFRRHEFYDLSHLQLDEKELLLLKPLTFMNRSGIAVSEATSANNIDPSNLLVIIDDLALPFGSIRMRAKGSSGGHNGLQSVIDYLKTEQFPRLRIGIKPEKEIDDIIDFVLSDFSKDERNQLEDIINKASKAALYFVEHGIMAAMNRFNS